MSVQTPQAQAQPLSSVPQHKWDKSCLLCTKAWRSQGHRALVTWCCLQDSPVGMRIQMLEGRREGRRIKKSVLLWLAAAANKSFQSLFWKLTLLGDLQRSLQHTQQMELHSYYWWRNLKYFLPPQMIVLISNTFIYKHRLLVKSCQSQINDFTENQEENKSQCLLPTFFFLGITLDISGNKGDTNTDKEIQTQTRNVFLEIYIFEYHYYIKNST